MARADILLACLSLLLMMFPANELMRLRQSLEDTSRDLQEKQNEHHLTMVKSSTLQGAIERERAGMPVPPYRYFSKTRTWWGLPRRLWTPCRDIARESKSEGEKYKGRGEGEGEER